MSRRRAESTAGRYAGERLLSTLDDGLDQPAGHGSAADVAFVFPATPDLPERAEPRRLSSTIRFRTGIRAALLIGALCLLGTGGFWWQALAGRTEVAPIGGAGHNTGSDREVLVPEESMATAASSGAGQPQTLSEETAGIQPSAVVHVAGAVNSPGVVTLPPGSRINDAIAAAGGPAAGSDPGVLNLAAIVTDGQRIFVPRPGEELPREPAGVAEAGTPGPAAGGGAAGTKGAAPARVNLNTATAAELDTLPKVGPVLAQSIIDWRLEHGPFVTVEELDAVDGVGPKMLETLLPLVTV